MPPVGYNCDPSLKTLAGLARFWCFTLSYSRYLHGNQTSLSTPHPAARACARFPPTHVHGRWPRSSQAATREGPLPPDRPEQRTRQARPLVKGGQMTGARPHSKRDPGEAALSTNPINRFQAGAASWQVVCPPTCCVIHHEIGTSGSAGGSQGERGGRKRRAAQPCQAPAPGGNAPSSCRYAHRKRLVAGRPFFFARLQCPADAYSPVHPFEACRLDFSNP